MFSELRRRTIITGRDTVKGQKEKKKKKTPDEAEVINISGSRRQPDNRPQIFSAGR